MVDHTKIHLIPVPQISIILLSQQTPENLAHRANSWEKETPGGETKTQIMKNPCTLAWVHNWHFSFFVALWLCGCVARWVLEDKHNNGNGHTITMDDSFLSSHMSSTYSDILMYTYLPKYDHNIHTNIIVSIHKKCFFCNTRWCLFVCQYHGKFSAKVKDCRQTTRATVLGSFCCCDNVVTHWRKVFCCDTPERSYHCLYKYKYKIK